MRVRDILDKVPDAAAISVASKTTVTSASGSVLAAFAGMNWTSIIASLAAVIGLVANIYFQLRRDRRERQETAARVAALQSGCAE